MQLGIPYLDNPYRNSTTVYAFSSDTEIWPGYIGPEAGYNSRYGVGTWLEAETKNAADYSTMCPKGPQEVTTIQSIEGGVQITQDLSGNNPYYRVIAAVCGDYTAKTQFVSLSPNILIRDPRSQSVKSGTDRGIQIPKCKYGVTSCGPTGKDQDKYNWSCSPLFSSGPNNTGRPDNYCPTDKSANLRVEWSANRFYTNDNVATYAWALKLNNNLVGFINPLYLDNFTSSSNRLPHLKNIYSLAHQPVNSYPGFAWEGVFLVSSPVSSLPSFSAGAGLVPDITAGKSTNLFGKYSNLNVSFDEPIGLFGGKDYPITWNHLVTKNYTPKVPFINIYSENPQGKYNQSIPKTINIVQDQDNPNTFYIGGPGGGAISKQPDP